MNRDYVLSLGVALLVGVLFGMTIGWHMAAGRRRPAQAAQPPPPAAMAAELVVLRREVTALSERLSRPAIEAAPAETGVPTVGRMRRIGSAH